MKKTKLVAATLGCLVLGATLASCGGGSSEGKTINFYCSAGNTLTPILAKATKAFEDENPGWKVKVINPGSYDDIKDKIKKDMKVNAQPALAYAYADHVAEYLATGKKSKVIDLKERFIANDKDYAALEKDFVQGYYKEGSSFGDPTKLYTLPFQRSTEVIYYNKTMLTAAGINESDLETWEGLWNACRTIKEKNPNVIPMGYDSESNWFITAGEQLKYDYTAAGATPEEKYLFNNDNYKAFLKELNDYYQEGLFTTQTILGGYTSNSFKKAELAMSIGSTGGANHQNPGDAFEYGIAPYPHYAKAGTVDTSISQGPSLVFFEQASDDMEDMAWKFAKHLYTTEFQAEFSSKSGYLPVISSAYESDTFKNFLNEDGIIPATIKVASQNKDKYYSSPAFKGSSEARKQVGVALTEAVALTTDVEAGIAKLLQEAYEMCAFFK